MNEEVHCITNKEKEKNDYWMNAKMRISLCFMQCMLKN